MYEFVRDWGAGVDGGCGGESINAFSARAATQGVVMVDPNNLQQDPVGTLLLLVFLFGDLERDLEGDLE